MDARARHGVEHPELSTDAGEAGSRAGSLAGGGGGAGETGGLEVGGASGRPTWGGEDVVASMSALARAISASASSTLRGDVTEGKAGLFAAAQAERARRATRPGARWSFTG